MISQTHFEWDQDDAEIQKWILREAVGRYRQWKSDLYHFFQREGEDAMPINFVGRENEWEFLVGHFQSPEFQVRTNCVVSSDMGFEVSFRACNDVFQLLQRRSEANKRNRSEKTMHHRTGPTPIAYTMQEMQRQGEEYPIIKAFERAYVREGDELTQNKYVST